MFRLWAFSWGCGVGVEDLGGWRGGEGVGPRRLALVRSELLSIGVRIVRRWMSVSGSVLLRRGNGYVVGVVRL